MVDMLVADRHYATLNTSVSGPVSASRECLLAFTNVSPKPQQGGVPLTKLKVVSLAVLLQRK